MQSIQRVQYTISDIQIDKQESKIERSCTITDFQQNTQALIHRLKDSGEPAFLTIEGKAELVVQSAEAYQNLLHEIEHLETLTGIKRGLESMQHKKGRPTEDVFQEMKAKIPALCEK